MILASIDWLRAGADILGAFGFAYVGQWWGYRQATRDERKRIDAVHGDSPAIALGKALRGLPPSSPHHHAVLLLRDLSRAGFIVVPCKPVPDRQDERLPR